MRAVVFVSILVQIQLSQPAGGEQRWRVGDGGWQGTYGAVRKQMSDFVIGYFGAWSRPESDVALDLVAKFYGSTTTYGGKTISRDELIEHKRKFVERWPIRVYIVRPSETMIWCMARDADPCFIAATVQWTLKLSNVDAGCSGVGKYDFEVLPTNGRDRLAPRIISESSRGTQKSGRNRPSCSD
jgi:hypothetical protein